jgi:hypothetical protein
MADDNDNVWPAANVPDKVEVQTVGYLPADTPVLYSDGLHIAFTPGVWVFSFLQTEFPLISTVDIPPDPNTGIRAVPAKCVVRVVVSSDRLPEYLKTILDTADRSRTKIKGYSTPEKETGNDLSGRGPKDGR